MIQSKLSIPINNANMKQAPNGMQMFIDFINVLEGYKTRIKNLHWAAEAMNIHLRLDEMLGVVSDYEDSIAEESMGIFQKLSPLDIVGTKCTDSDPANMLTSLLQHTNSFYVQLADDIRFAGMKSETEVFIHEINKHKYLFSLCKG